jgi:hypothetical protein
MPNNNSKRIGDGVFAVLDLVGLRLPDLAWWWQRLDIEEPTGRGAIIRTWGEGKPQGLDISYMLAVDVTADPTEPDVMILQAEGFQDAAKHLRDDITASVQGQGMRLDEWQSCELAETPFGKGLIYTYIATDQGKERQHLALRFRAHGRKTVVIACYDVTQASTLGPLMTKALQSSFIIAEPPVMLGSLFGKKLVVPGLYTGGSGDSVETAIVLNTKKRSVGVWAEYAYIERLHGSKNSGWRMLKQILIFGKDGRPYDVMRVELSDGSVRAYHFDISAFY